MSLITKTLSHNMFSVILPSYSEQPLRFHDLKDHRVYLKTMKGSLEQVNNVLLDPALPVEVILPSDPRRWQQEEWDEFQRMSAGEKRLIIESQCRRMVEQVSTTLVKFFLSIIDHAPIL